MNLLYKHQVTLIRAAELARAGEPSCGTATAELANLIKIRRDMLGVPHYGMAVPA